MTNPRLFTFLGGKRGPWKVTRLSAVSGEPLGPVERVEVLGDIENPADSSWALRGVTSYARYVVKAEQDQLAAHQPPLGRPEATLAALIPIKKSEEWWALTQDRRREILEDSSAHIATGLRYLPAIARRLHHGYELGEPFDFLTWFEYAPSDSDAFEELVAVLRATEEWRYVVREVDIRLVRDENYSSGESR